MDLFERLSKYDPVFKEVVSGYPNVASGAVFLESCGLSGQCLRELLRLFLVNVPDALIVRKHGFRTYSIVREYARVGVHGLYLEERGINPGTSADLVGASIYLLLRRWARIR
jgi:triphosphoribosyl-dephospho-CoA synthase